MNRVRYHYVPKGWHKTRFCYFFSKFQLLSKKSATKFLCVKTSSSTVVATSFLYLTVHRWIAGDVRIYHKFALKVTHPLRKRRLRQISLDSATAMGASEKNSISTNWKSTIDEPCTLPLSLPTGGSKREYLHLALPFISSLQVIVDISDVLKFCAVCHDAARRAGLSATAELAVLSCFILVLVLLPCGVSIIFISSCSYKLLH